MSGRRAERQAFCYMATPCPFCGTYGQMRFWRCPGGQVVVVCDECSAFFPSPERVGLSDALTDPKSPDWWSPDLGHAVAGPGSRYASRPEVAAAGWGAFVAGEG